eukprot:gb/GECH01009713.1/.p1 GENE.gb/GECH01009713.1/~~gb/GECH01009713.1/.p1  ORF type:complete len:537 (+),score=106.13 gb/GECH01009713.1/:1-1611(+)
MSLTSHHTTTQDVFGYTTPMDSSLPVGPSSTASSSPSLSPSPPIHGSLSTAVHTKPHAYNMPREVRVWLSGLHLFPASNLHPYNPQQYQDHDTKDTNNPPPHHHHTNTNNNVTHQHTRLDILEHHPSTNTNTNTNANTNNTSNSNSNGDPFSFVIQKLQHDRSIASPSHVHPSPPNQPSKTSNGPRRSAQMLMTTEVLSTQQQRPHDTHPHPHPHPHPSDPHPHASITADSMTSESSDGTVPGDTDTESHSHGEVRADDTESTRTAMTDAVGDQDMVLESQVVQYEHFVHQPVRRVFLLSGFSSKPSLKDQLHHMITELGGEVQQTASFTPQCTHLVCAKPSTTEKFLAATVAGKWVLKASYVEASYQERRWLPEAPYEWSARNDGTGSDGTGDKTTLQLCQAVDRCKDQPGQLFADWTALLLGHDSMVSGISSIIRAGGGKVREGSGDVHQQDISHLLLDHRHAEDPHMAPLIAQVLQAKNHVLKLDYVPKYVQDPDTDPTPFRVTAPNASRKRSRSRSRSRSASASTKKPRLRR